MARDPFSVLEDETGADGPATGVVDIKEYLRGIRRRWKLVLLLLVLATGASLAQFAVTEPIYVATTTLQIERRNWSSMVGPEAAMLDYMFSMDYYPTQYKLLESRGMAERVVKDLRLADEPQFSPGAGARSQGAEVTSDQDRVQLAQLANSVRSGLSVEPIAGTQLVALSYRSSSAERAARLVNAYAQTFIEWGIETRSGIASETSSGIAQQIAELEREIADRETEARQLVGRDGIGLGSLSDSQSTLIADVNSDFLRARAARREKEAAYNQLRSRPKELIASRAANVSAALEELRRLEREYQIELETFRENYPGMIERREKIETQRREVDALVEQEAALVLDGVRVDYESALRQERALEQEYGRVNEGLAINSSDSARYSTLQIELSKRRELIEQLLEIQSQTQVAVGLQSDRQSNIRVVDEALVPGRPAQPSLRRSASVGVAGGLALGIAIALLLEVLDRTIKSAGEAERLLGLPVLAVIPDLADEGRLGRYRRYGYGYGYGYGQGPEGESAEGRSAKKPRWMERKKTELPRIELVPHTRPRLAVSETYRALRTSLLLASAADLRKIAVTSASAGEGKTATSVNVSVVMAQLGGRVLLIDADLRKPRVHDVFGISKRVGLVNYLTGQAPVDQLVQRTDVPGLFVIPAGPTPPNPSELLGSSRMSELLEGALEHYNYVIVDTPPVLAVTDATVVGSIVDGVVLCLRAGRVTREEARACRDRLSRAEVKVLGVVLNAHHEVEAGYRKAQHYYAAYGEASDRETGSAA
jgi:capsular exopolysaccharide synthesis family protein